MTRLELAGHFSVAGGCHSRYTPVIRRLRRSGLWLDTGRDVGEMGLGPQSFVSSRPPGSNRIGRAASMV